MAASNDTGEETTSSPGASVDEQPLLEAGTAVGEYEIQERIGEGGFGAVYRAVHPVIGKDAAVKVLSPEFSAKPEMVSRFLAEARAANKIRHSGIIDIFNFGQLDDGRHYFVMELLDGVALDDFLERKGALDVPLALSILRAVSRALEAAHRKNIVHRDLKPGNIYLTFDEDGRPKPKLLDFGIAKLLGEAGAISQHRTRSGVPVGTPHYMAPEQCLGEEVDEGVDIYAFGICCFECLTGNHPFTGKNFLDLMNQQTTAPRPAVSQRNPKVPSELDEPIQRMMAIEKDERPASVAEAFQLLEEAAQAAGLDITGPMSEALSSDQAARASRAVSANTTPRSAALEPTTGSGEGGKSRALLVGGVVALAVGAYFASGAISTPAAPTSSSATAAPPPPPTPTAPPSSTAATPTTGAPAATSTAPPAPTPFSVKLSVAPAAAKATIYRVVDGDETELTVREERITIDGDAGDEVTLRVKATGYDDQEKTLTLGDDDALSVQLKPRAAPINPQLENPF